MHITLDGTTSIASGRENVFRLLTDPGFLARTIPDAEDVRVIDAKSLEAKIKLRLAVVSATMKMTMTVAETQPPAHAKLLADGSGSGSSVRIVSNFTLEGTNPTSMSWNAEADVTGVMAGLGSTVLKGFAAKKVREIFEGITRAIETSSAGQASGGTVPR